MTDVKIIRPRNATHYNSVRAGKKVVNYFRFSQDGDMYRWSPGEQKWLQLSYEDARTMRVALLPPRIFFHTKVNMEVFSQEDMNIYIAHDRIRTWKYIPGTDEFPFKYRAYDDDGVFYFEGVCKDNAEHVYDYTQWDAGVTEVRFYDRKTGKHIDTMG